ncbi:MAG: SUMF1/EgtB/PvdO family nonheme iron enzyme, partial [Verrucomicrobiota bacterium]
AGSYKPNHWGIFDMHGNVSEWCYDWFASFAPESLPDPTGPREGIQKVIRGGSFSTWGNDCTSASRTFTSPSASYSRIGFRAVLARELSID